MWSCCNSDGETEWTCKVVRTSLRNINRWVDARQVSHKELLLLWVAGAAIVWLRVDYLQAAVDALQRDHPIGANLFSRAGYCSIWAQWLTIFAKGKKGHFLSELLTLLWLYFLLIKSNCSTVVKVGNTQLCCAFDCDLALYRHLRLKCQIFSLLGCDHDFSLNILAYGDGSLELYLLW